MSKTLKECTTNIDECTTARLVGELVRRYPAGIIFLGIPDDDGAINTGGQVWGTVPHVEYLSALADYCIDQHLQKQERRYAIQSIHGLRDSEQSNERARLQTAIRSTAGGLRE